MTKKTSNLLQALERVKDNKLEDFIAPLPAGTIDLLSVQNGIPYWFEIICTTPGWYNIHPLGSRGSILSAKVEPYEIEDYLNQLPHFHVIALYPVSQGSWLCVPRSVGDTKQRGWQGQPKVFTLCQDNIEPLDVVRVANLAGTLIYHEVSKLTLESTPIRELLENATKEVKVSDDWWQAVKLVTQRLNQITQHAKKMTLQEEIEYRLKFVGAKLVDYQEITGGQLEVTYSYQGMTWTLPKVDKNLRIQSAGICLSGTDRQHNLSSIVEVMHEARKLRRLDLDRSYYL
jgi:hypothetical protein